MSQVSLPSEVSSFPPKSKWASHARSPLAVWQPAGTQEDMIGRLVPLISICCNWMSLPTRSLLRFLTQASCRAWSFGCRSRLCFIHFPLSAPSLTSHDCHGIPWRHQNHQYANIAPGLS